MHGHHQLLVLFQLSSLLVLNSVRGFPVKQDDDLSVLEDILLDQSVFEAIEESITRFLKQLSLLPSNETEISYQYLEIPKSDRSTRTLSDPVESTSHSGPAVQNSTETKAPRVVFMDESIQNAIDLSIKQNIRQFLYAGVTKQEPLMNLVGYMKSSSQEDITAGGNKSLDSNELPENKSLIEALQKETSDLSSSQTERDIPRSNEGEKREGSLPPKTDAFTYKLVVVPKDNKTNVPAELNALHIDPKSFGVVYTYLSPTGSFLIECDSSDGREALKNKIMKSSKLFIMPPRRRFPNQVRFSVPRGATEGQIYEAVLKNFNENALSVHFISFEDRSNYKVALVDVSNTLFEKMERHPIISIGTMQIRIDTSIRIERCYNCQLLGHRGKFCRLPTRPRPSPDENCIDCLFHNERGQGRNRERRDVRHSTNDDTCPTKRYFIAKWRRNIVTDDGIFDEDDFVPVPTQQDSVSTISSPITPPQATESKQETTRNPSPTNKSRSFAQALQAPSTTTSVPKKTAGGDKTRISERIPKLLHPLVVISRNPKADVVEELRATRIDLDTFGIKIVHVSPTGSLFLECDSEEGRDRLWRIITRFKNFDVVPGLKKFPNEVRMDVPLDATGDEVSRAIFESFHEYPIRVRFMPTNFQSRQFDVAILYVSDSLMKKIEAFPFVSTGRLQGKIDTSIYVDRCSNCRLLGHRSKFCRLPPRRYPSSNDRCIDCSYYNLHIPRFRRLTNIKPRNVDHRTHDKNCPTRQYFIDKWRRNRGTTDEAYERDTNSDYSSSAETARAVSTSVQNEDLVATPRTETTSITEISQAPGAESPRTEQLTTISVKENVPAHQRIAIPMVLVPKIPEKNVIDELQRLSINLDSYGIKINYASPKGSLHIEFESEEDIKALREIIKMSETLDIQVQKKKFPHEARVDVPELATEDEVSKAVFDNYGEYPSQVIFIPISSKIKWKRAKIALLHVSDGLLKLMEASPNLSVGRLRSRIDTRIRVDRCENCQLLGHRGKYCSLASRPTPSPTEKCLDCSYLNEQLRKIGSQTREIDHVTDDENCPVKQYLIDQWRKNRGTGEGSLEDHTSASESASTKTSRSTSQPYASIEKDKIVTTPSASDNLEKSAELRENTISSPQIEERAADLEKAKISQNVSTSRGSKIEPVNAETTPAFSQPSPSSVEKDKFVTSRSTFYDLEKANTSLLPQIKVRTPESEKAKVSQKVSSSRGSKIELVNTEPSPSPVGKDQLVSTRSSFYNLENTGYESEQKKNISAMPQIKGRTAEQNVSSSHGLKIELVNTETSKLSPQPSPSSVEKNKFVTTRSRSNDHENTSHQSEQRKSTSALPQTRDRTAELEKAKTSQNVPGSRASKMELVNAETTKAVPQPSASVKRDIFTATPSISSNFENTGYKSEQKRNTIQLPQVKVATGDLGKFSPKQNERSFASAVQTGNLNSPSRWAVADTRGNKGDNSSRWLPADSVGKRDDSSRWSPADLLRPTIPSPARYGEKPNNRRERRTDMT